ncbi:hypothetical protein CXR34_08785 [Microbacterium hominis]|uniref:Uncharacterized protein n=1 Tax=Microbacterium hominis TaxID=162426 RepID=A0A2K9D9H7_9MICO|nr:hypothetical protein CXR34_08785 [Microbacterium hominis]
MPPWLNVLVALVLALPVCVFLAGRALSWFRLAVAVSISQLLFHALLSVPLGVSGAPAPAHDHHAMGSSMLSSIGGVAVSMPDHAVADGSMWVAHVVAALITVLMLGRGEQAVLAVAQLLGLAGLVALRLFVPLRPFRVVRVFVAEPVLALPGRLFSVVRWRGPPVVC